jgi:hypothetical protein
LRDGIEIEELYEFDAEEFPSMYIGTNVKLLREEGIE